jgi:hypothetical protein
LCKTLSSLVRVMSTLGGNGDLPEPRRYRTVSKIDKVAAVNGLQTITSDALRKKRPCNASTMRSQMDRGISIASSATT